MLSQLVGWREHVTLPAWGLRMDAKMDTGALSCTLHAIDIDPQPNGRVRFRIALDPHAAETVDAEAEVLEWRWIKDSTGHGSLRPIVIMTIEMGGHTLQEEVSLGDRLGLKHRLLIGRRAMLSRFVVDPSKEYQLDAGPTDFPDGIAAPVED